MFRPYLYLSCLLCASAQFTDDMQVYQQACLGEDRFQCLDGGCISLLQHCDGQWDCADGSDEDTCANRMPEPATCEQLKEFPCSDGKKCVPYDWVCNGVIECDDSSDEINCTKFKVDKNSACKGFKCGDGHCISPMWVCDAVYDCADKSDESPSTCRTPPKVDRYDADDKFCDDFEFDRKVREENYVFIHRCLDKSMCLLADFMCNGLEDCRDGSDEGPFCANWSTMCSNVTCGDTNATCVATRDGPACKCTQLYNVYNSTSRLCYGKDHCKLAAPQCPQKCDWGGKGGSFFCRCDPGYRPDRLGVGYVCFAPDPEGLLFFSTQNDVRYLKLKSRQSVIVATGIKQAHGVTYDGNFVYWVETAKGHQSIVRGRLDDAKFNKETILSIGLEDVGDLALDWMGGHIYFSDAERGTIAACRTDGSMCTTVLKRSLVHVPRFITLDPKNGQMFWVDWREGPVILRSPMNGRNVTVLVSLQHGTASGLAWDEPSGRLFFADSAIRGVRVDDGQIFTVTKDQVHHPYSLAVFENAVYWSDWSSNSILASDKTYGRMHVFKPYKVNTTVFGMHIYHPILMNRTSNPCKKHDCSHMCLVASNQTHACACPDGMELIDMNHCHDIEGYRPQYLVVGSGSYFTRIQYDRLGNLEYHATQFDISRVQATAYDSFRDTLYLYDGARKSINYVNMSDFTLGVTQLLVYDGLDDVVDMDYDYASDSLYVLDAGRSFVEVISLRSKKRALVYRFELETPISLCVIPEYGKMLIAVAGTDRDVYIDSFGLDGSGRTNIVKTNLKGSVIRLRYSQYLDNVFLADEGSSTIEFMHHEGQGREVYRELSTSITSLAVTDTYVFWTDRRTSRLYWSDAHEATPRIRRIELAGFPNTTRLHLQVTTLSLDQNLPLLFHPCRRDPCADVCVQVPHEYEDPRGYKCLCAPGLMDVDGVCTGVVHCKDYEGYCHKSNRCFDKKGLCDRKNDCPKGEDEEGCVYPPQPTCSPHEVLCNGRCTDEANTCSPEKKANAPEGSCEPHEFTCKTHPACIERRLLCDGQRDCPDGSDEAEDMCDTFTCLDSEFMCSSGSCVLSSFKCDGDWDCSDGSDELGCIDKTCLWGQFSCGNGLCVELKQRCDHHDDCLDNSDEEDCDEEEVIDVNQEEPENCPDWEFPCELDRNICVLHTARCNHKTECPGGTDELGCTEGCFTPGYLPCREDFGCVPRSKFCDGKRHCADGSDETAEACNMVNKTSSPLYPIILPNDECTKGYRCKDGQCVDWHQVCDRTADCYDGSDENGLCSTACENSTCDFQCKATPSGAVCRCPDGYQRQSTLHACINTNECLADVCAQQCYDVEGSYVCGCYHGYALRADRHSCKARRGGMAVYYVSAGCVRAAADGRAGLVYNGSAAGAVSDIDVDVRRSKLYVTSAASGKLVVTNGTQSVVTITNIGQPTKVAVDWVTGNVYFVDASPAASRLRVCSALARRCAALLRLPSAAVVTQLVVDPASRRMFYCITKDMESILWSASLAGDRVVEVATLASCSGLAVDSFAKRLYVAEISPPRILRMSLSGGGQEEYIANDTNLETPRGLAIFENHIYFLIANSFKLNRCLLYGRKTCELYLQRVFDANTFVLHHESVQRDDIPNVCSGFDCDNLCALGENGPQCLCDDGSFSKTGRCPLGVENELARFDGRAGRAAPPRPLGETLAVSGALLLAALLAVAGYYRVYRDRLRRAAPLVPVHFQNVNSEGSEELLPERSTHINIPASTSSQRRTEFVNPLQLIRDTWRQSFRRPRPVGTAGLIIDSPFGGLPDTSQSQVNVSDTESDLDDKDTQRIIKKQSG